MTDARPTKIWYQSFIEPGRDRPYFDKLGAFLRTLAAPGVSYELNGIDPPNQELHRITEFRCAAQVVRNALRAQVEGYDAFAIGHYQDFRSLRGSRGRCAYRCSAWERRACSSLALWVVILPWWGSIPSSSPIHEECVARYGLRDRYVGIQVVETKVQDLVDAFTDPEAPGANVYSVSGASAAARRRRCRGHHSCRVGFSRLSSPGSRASRWERRSF